MLTMRLGESPGPHGPVSYSLGNGLNVYNGYDKQGRLNGEWVCQDTAAAPDCPGGNYPYGFTVNTKGSQVQSGADTALNQHFSYVYGDGLNRLTALTVTQGMGASYAYAYDRCGNRVSQTVTAGSGIQPATLSFSAATNQIAGFAYDAAGNVTNDTTNTYTCDAEGNILSGRNLANGATGSYVYDALNRRVSAATSAGTLEYVYDYAGRRISTWDAATNNGIEGRIYWDGRQIAFRADDGTTYFDHQNWLGTERLRTNYKGAVAATITSLPFGDGSSTAVAGFGAEQDNADFATLDYDPEIQTEHARFRNYSSEQGRWLSPDPYAGSYDITNPQSFNRYAYALNNPLSFTDPSGLECVWDDGSYDAADDPTTGDIEGCTTAGGYYVDPEMFEEVEGNLPGSWSGQANSSIAFDWTTPFAIVEDPNKVGCGTVLPNGQTLGQYINQGRAQLQAVVDNQNALAAAGGDVNPFSLTTTFASIAAPYGQIDFKNGAAGTSVLATNLGLAGNFAYYAIGSGYLSPTTLDIGASVYSHGAALLGRKPFSSLTGPLGIDASAASVRNAALATPGCPG